MRATGVAFATCLLALASQRAAGREVTAPLKAHETTPFKGFRQDQTAEESEDVRRQLAERRQLKSCSSTGWSCGNSESCCYQSGKFVSCCKSGTHCSESGNSCIKSDDKVCFAEDTMVHSCTEKTMKRIKDVRVGEELKSVSASGTSECSRVFYVYDHDSQDSKILDISFSNSTALRVSPWHLVFVCKQSDGCRRFSERESVPAHRVKAGDTMFAEAGIVVVQSVKETRGNLVQVLTDNSHVMTGDGIFVSTYSYHENLYSLFAFPLKMMAKTFGYHAPKTSMKTLDSVWQKYGHPSLVKAL